MSEKQSDLLKAAETVSVYMEGVEGFFQLVYAELPEEGESTAADKLMERLESVREHMEISASEVRVKCMLYEQGVYDD